MGLKKNNPGCNCCAAAFCDVSAIQIVVAGWSCDVNGTYSLSPHTFSAFEDCGFQYTNPNPLRPFTTIDALNFDTVSNSIEYRLNHGFDAFGTPVLHKGAVAIVNATNPHTISTWTYSGGVSPDPCATDGTFVVSW